jgi:hypothetical protein
MDILHLRALEREFQSIDSQNEEESDNSASEKKVEEDEVNLNEVEEGDEEVKDDFADWKVLSWLTHLAMHE